MRNPINAPNQNNFDPNQNHNFATPPGPTPMFNKVNETKETIKPPPPPVNKEFRPKQDEFHPPNVNPPIPKVIPSGNRLANPTGFPLPPAKKTIENEKRKKIKIFELLTKNKF